MPRKKKATTDPIHSSPAPPSSILKRVNYANKSPVAQKPSDSIGARIANRRQPQDSSTDMNQTDSQSNNQRKQRPARKIISRRVSVVTSVTSEAQNAEQTHLESVEQSVEEFTHDLSDGQRQEGDSISLSGDLMLFERTCLSIQDDFTSFCSPRFQNATKAECQMRLNVLENRKQRMDAQYEQFRGATNADFIYNDACDTFNSAHAFLSQKLQQISIDQHMPAIQSHQVVRVEFDSVLTPIKLPEFDGDHAKWRDFKSTFEEKVHNNPKISFTDKLLRLKAAMVGSAATSLGHWITTPENYERAWYKICNIYDNEYLMVRSHVQRLFDLKYEFSSEGIRNLISTVTNSTQQLEVLKANTAELMILHIIESKLDSKTRHNWEMKRDSRSIPTLEEFLDFLDNHARNLTNEEMWKVANQQAPTRKTFEPPKFQRFHPYSQRGNAYSRTAQVDRTKPRPHSLPPCRLCNADHGLFHCPVFDAMELDVREMKIAEWRLCISCFGKHHVDYCPRPSHCRLCNVIHNSMLCPKRQKNQGKRGAAVHMMLNDMSDPKCAEPQQISVSEHSA